MLQGTENSHMQCATNTHMEISARLDCCIVKSEEKLLAEITSNNVCITKSMLYITVWASAKVGYIGLIQVRRIVICSSIN